MDSVNLFQSSSLNPKSELFGDKLGSETKHLWLTVIIQPASM